ncbi:nucleotidyltransferase [Sediminibacillus massiliensis]|uniref:nucleotidyltransferase n=1 Tax=Sediminibacillus massiliensis TaxID=1926277 RepID=UPI00098860C3|nr:nucleotidyltransferase [Sediminibacillus massiliensis]
MDACGLIVEYNPFHFGHKYHLEQSRQLSGADCMVAVMSGNFLQRGEPAIIDKFERAKAAIDSGVDLVVELPTLYAVQNSDYFAKGALMILGELGVDSICFGSEQGKTEPFLHARKTLEEQSDKYTDILKHGLSDGLSFPEASRSAYETIGLSNKEIDLTKPNNILGFSYIKAIHQLKLSIRPMTIKRIHNDYHDTEIQHQIASATSIRKELHKHRKLTEPVNSTLPGPSKRALERYLQKAKTWHNWEAYFSILQYRVLTMPVDQLKNVFGIREGLEYRLKKTAKEADSFESWMQLLKTKRYTWTRLQRVFVNILLHNEADSVSRMLENDAAPYIRILAMSPAGRSYLNLMKKKLNSPLYSKLPRENNPVLALEERATDGYYSILPPRIRKELRKKEIMPPYMAT